MNRVDEFFEGRAAQGDLVVDAAAREVQRVLESHVLEVDRIEKVGAVDPQTVRVDREVRIGQYRA